MREQRKTQAELAARLGISQAAVSRRLSGEVDFRVKEMLIIDEWLGQPAAVGG
jgi:transcriptional regulator with XRE-family HTH domain